MTVEAIHPGADASSPIRALLTDRRLGAMVGLGFSSGIPFLLVYITQSAWLSEANVPIGILGLMSEMTLAYKFKWVWAPFLDRYDAPLFSRLLGRRRGWIVLSQVGVVSMLAGIAFGDPAHRLGWTVAFSLALGFAGATQDITIDGWRITVAPVERQALMSSWAEVGWRIGNLVAGAGALYLADFFGWRTAYLCMAVAMAPGLIAAWLAPEPDSDKAAHETPRLPPFNPGRSDQGPGDPTRPDGGPDPAARRRLPHARLHLVRHGRAAVQEPALFQLGYRHRHQAVRLPGGHRGHLCGNLRGETPRPVARPVRRHGLRLRVASEPRLPRGARRPWRR